MLRIFFVEGLNTLSVIKCFLQLFLLLQVLVELLHDLNPLLLSQNYLRCARLSLHLRLLRSVFGRGVPILIISFVFYLLLLLNLRLITINCRIRHLLLHLVWLELRACDLICILSYSLGISTSWLLRSNSLSSRLLSICVFVYRVR